MSPQNNVAIIGAGLSGLALALALRKQSIPCTIYEARPASLNIGGAIMLSPNALKVLNSLGVYERIRPLGFEFENLYFRTEDDQLLDTYEFGSQEKYGYKALRIYRHIVIDHLLEMVNEAGITIRYGQKYTRVISETDDQVTWEFQDGSQETAGHLVGADGIHSRVRKHLYPDLEPRFTNMAGITAAVPTSQLKIPNSYGLPVTIMNSKHGSFTIAEQQPDGSEVLIGKQMQAMELNRAGWDALLSNKEWSVGYLQEGKDNFPEIVRSAVSHIPHGKINIWPFYLVPKLDTWVSDRGRVIILGDAAHAIPPTAGQGVNQAFEDVYTFSLILGSAEKKASAELMTVWQIHRQARINRILALNDQINARRVPGVDAVLAEKKFDLEWLYKPDFDEMVTGWIAIR